jgi:hypothetical protein
MGYSRAKSAYRFAFQIDHKGLMNNSVKIRTINSGIAEQAISELRS